VTKVCGLRGIQTINSTVWLVYGTNAIPVSRSLSLQRRNQSRKLVTSGTRSNGRKPLDGRCTIRLFKLVKKRQEMCVQRNTEARSCNQCGSRKINKYYIFWECVCSLRYPACNAHAPYCHLWHTRPYYIFAHYLIKSTIFEKKNTEHKICVLIFSTNFVRNISHSEWTWARYVKKFILVFTLSARHSCQSLMKL